MASRWREVMAVARIEERPFRLCRGTARERLGPNRAERRLFRDELAARGFLEEVVVPVEDWQILEEIAVDAGFDALEVAWFAVGEVGEPAPRAPAQITPPRARLGARVRSWLRALASQAQPALPGG